MGLEQELAIVKQRKENLHAFKTLMSRDDKDISVLEGAILLAKSKYVTLQAQSVHTQLDELAQAVETELGSSDTRYPMRVLAAITKVMFKSGGWRGNDKEYYSADNSFINKVLENKTGIPITLCLVYMEIAARVGLPMVGVSLPFHYMCRPIAQEMEVLVDAFHGGEVCFLEDAEALLAGLFGQPVKLDPQIVRSQPPPSSRAMLYRLCGNLKSVCMASKDVELALLVNEFMRVAMPEASENIRDEGLCLFFLKRYPEARARMVEYIEKSPDALDLELARQVLKKIDLA